MCKQLIRLVLIAVLAIGVGGIFAAPRAVAGEGHQTQGPRPAAVKTPNDLLADVARLAPGFGGVFVDPELKTVYVYLLEDTPEALAAAETAYAAVFGRRRPQHWRIVVLKGQYSFLELKEWHDRMSALHGTPGGVSTGISHSWNRVTVGVATEETRDLVEEQVVRLGIPREAVIIEEEFPVKFGVSREDFYWPEGQVQDVTLTLRTDQATYPVGSRATVTLTLRSTTRMTVVIGGHDVLGCSWNILMLDATGTEVFNARADGGVCPDIGRFRNIPVNLMKEATIPLHNNLRGGEPLPPGRYTVRGVLWWQGKTVSDGCGPRPQGCGPQSAEAIIEIIR